MSRAPEYVVVAGITIRCAECEEPFTEAEWVDRHDNEDGEDIHEDCCLECRIAEAAAVQDG